MDDCIDLLAITALLFALVQKQNLGKIEGRVSLCPSKAHKNETLFSPFYFITYINQSLLPMPYLTTMFGSH